MHVKEFGKQIARMRAKLSHLSTFLPRMSLAKGRSPASAPTALPPGRGRNFQEHAPPRSAELISATCVGHAGSARVAPSDGFPAAAVHAQRQIRTPRWRSRSFAAPATPRSVSLLYRAVNEE